MRTVARSLALAVLASLVVVGLPTGPSPAASPPGDADRAAERVVRPASLTRTAEGYHFSSWGQSNRVTVTLVDGRLRFRDPHAVRWEHLARSCRNVPVDPGVAATCRVPTSVNPIDPMTLGFQVRLGDDHVDTSSLPADFEASVLADAGVDEIRTGAGDDFVNGAFHRDVVVTGDGADWVRSGAGGDRVLAGLGNDHLVGGEAGDRLHGEIGNDLVEGGPGDDTVYGDEGADRLKCGDGDDAAEDDPADLQRVGCEGSVA